MVLKMFSILYFNIGSVMTSFTENQLISLKEQLSFLPGQLISHEINKYRYTPNSEEPSLQKCCYNLGKLKKFFWTHCNLKVKKLILCHKFWFSNPYIFVTKCLYIYQTMSSVWSNNLSLKYQSFTTIRLQRYREKKIWVCGKDSIPLLLLH